MILILFQICQPGVLELLLNQETASLNEEKIKQFLFMYKPTGLYILILIMNNLRWPQQF